MFLLDALQLYDDYQGYPGKDTIDQVNLKCSILTLWMRIRHGVARGTTSDTALELMKAAADYQGEIAQCVPDWNEGLRIKRLLLKNGPKEITTQYGERLRPPLGNTPINQAYSVECLTFGQVKQLSDLRASSFKYWPK